MTTPRFQMRQCLQGSCRFRFPVPAGSAEGEQCPRCGALTTFATKPRGGWAPPTGSRAPGLHVEALLDNIRSIFNVGSIFRTADGAGLRRLHLAGITATPEHPKVAKTALGAETAVPWHYYSNGLVAARTLKQQGYRLWALESGPSSSSLFDHNQAGDSPLLFIVGNEKAGVDPGILDLCEHVLHIPMAGRKASLNVAIAFGVAAYYLRYGKSLPQR
jgi:tRNA G18 (ribose-2'-O)-methylase SpoU